MSYSQHGEEQYILSALQGIENGTFLDIGAYHPTVFSNTRALYELGWSGVMLEPSPAPFLTLLREYGEDRRIVLVNVAATVQENLLCISIHATEDAVSTTDEDIYRKWKDTAKYMGVFYCGVIPIKSLQNMAAGGFQFVNIDAEGESVPLFQKMLETWQVLPKCVCVEHDGQDGSVIAMASEHGYSVVHHNGTNIVLAK